MGALPTFAAITFPNHLTVADYPLAPIPVENLTDEQAGEVWDQQRAHFIAHVRKRRARATYVPQRRHW